MTAVRVSPDGRFLAYALSEAGSDWRTIKVLEVGDRRRPAGRAELDQMDRPDLAAGRIRLSLLAIPGAGRRRVHRRDGRRRADAAPARRRRRRTTSSSGRGRRTTSGWPSHGWPPTVAWLVLTSSPGTDSRSTSPRTASPPTRALPARPLRRPRAARRNGRRSHDDPERREHRRALMTTSIVSERLVSTEVPGGQPAPGAAGRPSGPPSHAARGRKGAPRRVRPRAPAEPQGHAEKPNSFVESTCSQRSTGVLSIEICPPGSSAP